MSNRKLKSDIIAYSFEILPPTSLHDEPSESDAIVDDLADLSFFVISNRFHLPSSSDGEVLKMLEIISNARNYILTSQTSES